MAGDQLRLLDEGGGELRLVDVALFLHPPEDPELPPSRGLEVSPRVQFGGFVGKPGEQGGLGEGEVAEGFAEIPPRRGPRSGELVAVGETVEVGGEDGLLVGGHLEMPRGEGLDELGPEIAAARGRAQFHGLLGDGRGTGDEPPVEHRVAHGAEDADEVDAAVGEETRVLRREGGVDEMLRELAEGGGLVGAKLAVEEPPHRPVLPVDEEESGRCCRAEALREGEEPGEEVECDEVEPRAPREEHEAPSPQSFPPRPHHNLSRFTFPPITGARWPPRPPRYRADAEPR